MIYFAKYSWSVRRQVKSMFWHKRQTEFLPYCRSAWFTCHKYSNTPRPVRAFSLPVSSIHFRLFHAMWNSVRDLGTLRATSVLSSCQCILLRFYTYEWLKFIAPYSLLLEIATVCGRAQCVSYFPSCLDFRPVWGGLADRHGLEPLWIVWPARHMRLRSREWGIQMRLQGWLLWQRLRWRL